MATTNEPPKDQATVILLCPRCEKRLPLSGRLAMRGTTGIFCRHCRCTVQVTMEVAEKKPLETMTTSEELRGLSL